MPANIDSRSATRTKRSVSAEHDFDVGVRLLPESLARTPLCDDYFSSLDDEQRLIAASSTARHDLLIPGNDLPIMVWEANEDGLLDYYNRRVYDYSGTTAEQLLGTGWLSIVHPDDRRRAAQRWSIAIATGERYEIEFRIRASSGNYRWFLVQANACRGVNGDPARWIGTCTDIDRLMSGVDGFEAEGRFPNDQLLYAEGSAMLRQLAVTAAHALRQPLTAILSNAQALQSMLRTHAGFDPEAQEILADIVHEDKRAVEILRRLRTPPIAGPIQETATDINAALREIAVVEQQNVMSYGCQLELKLARNLPLVPVDNAQMQHVIASLLLARCEAMHRLSTRDRRLMVRTTRRARNFVRIALTDSATDAFAERTAVANSLQPDRIGLVAAMCRSVIAAHGGEISIRSHAERGTTVFIDLPVGTD